MNRGETTFESREEEIVEGFRPIQHSKTDISRKSLTARQMEEAKWKWEEGKLLKEKKDIQALLEKGKGYRFQAWTMLEGLERAFEEKMENDLELWRKRSSRPSDQVYLKERERDMEILASRLNNVIDVVRGCVLYAVSCDHLPLFLIDTLCSHGLNSLVNETVEFGEAMATFLRRSKLSFQCNSTELFINDLLSSDDRPRSRKKPRNRFRRNSLGEG